MEENVWSNPQINQFVADIEDPGLAVSLFDLVKAFGEVLERAQNRPFSRSASEEVSVSDMILHVRSLLRREPQGQTALHPAAHGGATHPARHDLPVSGCAGNGQDAAVQILQADLFGEIALAKGERLMSEALPP